MHEVTVGWFVIGDPEPTGGTCPVCGFDSLYRRAAWMLTGTGVTRAEVIRCGRGCRPDTPDR